VSRSWIADEIETPSSGAFEVDDFSAGSLGERKKSRSVKTPNGPERSPRDYSNDQQ
jgi:hypothetical protein